MQTKHYPIALILAIFVVGTSFYLNTLVTPAAVVDAKTAVADLSTQRYTANVTHLSRDEMKGRGNGSQELENAADYIASQFRIWGLKPGGAKNGYFQPFEITTGTQFGAKNELSIEGTVLKKDSDFVPISFSNASEFEGPVVFVGYGITAPEMHYDDYQGVDAKDKIVVAFRHEPQELDAKSPFAGTNFTSHASFINKAINARQHGAKGIIFITDPNNHAGEEDALGPSTRGTEPDDIGIASVHARRDAILPLFAKAGKNLGDIQRKIDTDVKGQSFELTGARARISTDVVRTRKTVRNVLATVTGTDPRLRNEWVVVGAHYDHLGLGDRSSLAPSEIGQIHHGADDNASGSAGVLELARLASKNRPKRSVLFMTFAGEELGLLGS